MNPIERCRAEQRRCRAEILSGTSKDLHGAELGLDDWFMEELLLEEQERKSGLEQARATDEHASDPTAETEMQSGAIKEGHSMTINQMEYWNEHWNDPCRRCTHNLASHSVFGGGCLHSGCSCERFDDPHETQESIGRWGDETFGTSYSAIVIGARANTEMAELLRELARYPNTNIALQVAFERKEPDVAHISEEAADVLVLLYQLAHTCGFDLHEALDAKMRINRGRVWALDKDGTGHHVRVKG